MALPEKYIRLSRYLLIAFILFVVYNTLIPFRPYTSVNKIIREIHNIEYLPFIRDGRFVGFTDIVGNVLLFFPIGFLARLFYDSKKRPQLQTIGMGFLLSFFIEFTQIFLHYRIASVHDLITNTLGAWIGTGAATIFLKYYLNRFLLTVRLFLKSSVQTILFFILLVYLILFIWIALFALPPYFVKNIFLWENITLALLLFVLILFLSDGIKILKVLPRNVGRLIAALFVVPLIIDLILQPAMFAWSMVAMVLAGGIVKYNKSELFKLKAGLLILGIFILLDNLQPFIFRTVPVLHEATMIKGFIPFYYYYKVTSIWNLNDLAKMLMEGFIFAEILQVTGRGKLKNSVVLTSGIFISLAMETAQLFIRGRTMDITDTGMFTAGVITALFVSNYPQPHSGKNTDKKIEQGAKTTEKQGIR